MTKPFGGNKGKQRKGARGWFHKEKIFSLVERGGQVRSFYVEKVNASTLRRIMIEQIEKDSCLVTDDFKSYETVGKEFFTHDVICHSKGEYVRDKIHTNTIEGFFSILKRGLIGVYQHISPQHLKRYIGEFDFRYNNRHINDMARSEIVLQGIEGKRLLYRDSRKAAMPIQEVN